MNNLAILPYICLHALQIQNVKRDVVKKVDIKELNKNDIQHPVDENDLSNTNEFDNTYNDIENNNNIQHESTNIDELPQPISASEDFGSQID